MDRNVIWGFSLNLIEKLNFFIDILRIQVGGLLISSILGVTPLEIGIISNARIFLGVFVSCFPLTDVVCCYLVSDKSMFVLKMIACVLIYFMICFCVCDKFLRKWCFEWVFWWSGARFNKHNLLGPRQICLTWPLLIFKFSFISFIYLVPFTWLRKLWVFFFSFVFMVLLVPI